MPTYINPNRLRATQRVRFTSAELAALQRDRVVRLSREIELFSRGEKWPHLTEVKS